MISAYTMKQDIEFTRSRASTPSKEPECERRNRDVDGALKQLAFSVNAFETKFLQQVTDMSDTT